MKIENYTLTKEFEGVKVTYVPNHANNDYLHEDCEQGIITSWNESYVFVDYGKGTNAATRPENLLLGHSMWPKRGG